MKNSTSLFAANKGFTAQLFLVLFAFFSTLNGWGQVTTNGGSGLAGTYNTLAEAITALNSATISSPVIITLTGNENAPVGGYNITKSGTSTNTITIQGSSSTITAATSQASGNLVDAIFKITGADWITIQNFTMQENAANTTTTAASNNMTEFGVALFYATTTNGAQNNTIQNNTISLNRTYQNTFGIYSNSTHSATALTSASATTAAGGNSGLKIYTNTISNVNQGICVVGPTAAADLNTGLDIGGTSAGQGNSITNWGTTGTFSSYINVSGTLNCILVRNCAGYNISYNTLTSSAGGNTVTTSQRAIYVPSFSAAPTTAVTCTISNNNISVQSGLVAGTVNGIIVESTTGSALSSLTISSNNFNTMGHTVASPTGAHTYISSAMAHLNTTINNNTFTNISASTTGSITFISNAISVPTAGGTQTINGNSIVTAFAKTGAGGTVTVFSSNSSSVTGSIISMQNNNFSNITMSGSASFVGINNTDGGSPTKTISGNTFNNISGGTGSINPMTINFFGGSSSVSNNTITNINWGAAVTAITIGSSSSAASLDVNNNTINTISSTAGSVVGLSVASPSTVTNVSINAINNLSSTAAATITGISISGATTTNVFRNKIFSLSGNNASTTINGLQISLGTSINVYNNLIGNLTATAANAANPIIGLNITGGTTVNASYNSIYLDNLTSSGALFGASGIFASTTPNLTLRNNLVRVTGTANGASNIAAYRRSGNTLTSYSTSSNNNLFFAGTPSSTNLIYTENTSAFTNSQQTLAAYKSFISTRDQASATENVSFQSTTGSSADFLKYNTTVASQVESGGVAVSGITTDFAGTTRNSTTPDIGAWELNGIAADLTEPSISYTALSNTLCTNGQSLTATITDASGVNTTAGTKPRIYFKKSTDVNTYLGNTSADNGWKFVESSSSTSPFSFTMDASLLQTSLAAGDVIQYFVVAQDLATVPNVGVNSGTFAAAPSSVALTSAAFALTGTINSYTINSAVATAVTIGAAGTYPSITGIGGLFAAINVGGLSGNTVATIIDASVTESGAVALNQITYGCTANSTLTIKPQTTATLTGSVASGALIKLNGADYVTIDGSNSGGTDKSLTITNTETTAPTAVALISTGTGAGATNNTIKNCNISTGVQTTIGYGISVGGSTPGTAGADNDNNTIQNNTFTQATAPIYAFGTANSSSGGIDNLIVSSNSISYTTTINATIGMRFGNALNANISNNTISVETSNTTISGISLETGFINSNIAANVINKVKSTTASGLPIVRGIVVGTGQIGSNVTISNNIISNVISAYATTILGYNNAGILLGATGVGTTFSITTGGINLYHNSINLFGTVDRSSAVTSGFSLFIGSACSSLNIRNNIFANSIVNGNASAGTSKSYAIYSQAANTAFTAINYNNYFVSGSQGYLGFLTSDRTDLAGIVTGFGGNANSMNVNPQFVSETDLHINSGSTQTQLESGGVAISGLTSDIDGQTRPGPTGSTNGGGTAPDIGADEFDGVPSLSMSYTSSTTEQVTGSAYAGVTNQSIIRVKIVTTGVTSPLSLTNLTLNANGTTAIGDINAATAKVYYTGASTTFSTSSLFGATTPTIANFTVTGSQTLVEGNNYFWLAYDVASAATSANLIDGECIDLTVGTIQTPTVSAPSGNKSILGAMTGTYAVGASQTETGSAFTKLTTAIADLNLRGVSGAVTFALQSDYTSATETFPLTINAVTGASVTNTVTIKPAATVTATISGSSSSSIFKLNGADYVIIDGSNNGSTSKDLTITNTNTGTSSAVVWLGSASVSNGATNNTIKNCIITGNAPTTTLVGIISSSGTTIGDAAQIANANNTYNNNTVNTAYYGIAVIGPTGNESGTVISGNLIGSATAGNKIGGIGILVNNQSGVSVTGNTIFGVTTSTDYTASGIYVYGTQSGGTISGNNISDIKNTSLNHYDANGIFLGSSSTTANIDIYNNIIFDITAVGETSSSYLYYNGHGIVLYSGGGYNIYSNTVNMNTNQTDGLSSAIYITSSLVTAASVNIRNNIFANTQTGGANAGKRYAIYCAAANTIFGTINHNNYYTSGTHLGYRGSNRTTLAEVVTGFGGNANSVNISPTFVSSTNLHLNPSSNCTLDNKGVFIAGVTTDIDGDTRSNSTPDIGADEFTFTGTTFTWTGGENTTNPMTAGNWDLNALPSSCSNITIPGGLTYYPSYSSPNANLTINSGTTLTLQTGARFSIDGTLTNNGTLTIESGATLVQGASSTLDGTGTYNVKQDITGTNNGSAPSGRFWYLGSPVTLASSSVYFGNAANVVKKRDEVNNTWTALSSGTPENLVVGQGYYTQAMGNATINFTGGLLNNGAITIGNLSRTAGQGFEGFNLVSNPYPSYLDWDAVTKTDVGNTMWYRTFNSTNNTMVFDTYVAGTNGIGTNLNGAGVSNLIPPMQSFWVRVNANANPSLNNTGSLGLSNSMRAHFTSINGSVAGLKSTSNERDLFLRMNLLQANKKDQIIVYVNDDATNGFDQFDGEKMMQAGMPQFYTSAAGKKITINGLNSAKKQQALPITMELPTTGVHSFVIEDLEIDNGLVWLEDKQEEIMQALEPGTVYEFYANSGINAARFVLHFQLIDNTTPINVYNEVNGSANFSGKGASVHAESAGVVVIKLPLTTEGITDIQIRDAAGKLVYTGSTNTLETSIQLAQANGIYYVTLNSATGVEVRKVFIQQ